MTTSLVNAGRLSLTAPDYLTEVQVHMLENGATLPEPAVLGNKCAAYRVWADVLQPIQSVGTAIQPACYAYDDADNMTMLKTFRAGAETISSNPSERTDADITTWEYHASTGLELRKTYADGTSVI